MKINTLTPIKVLDAYTPEASLPFTRLKLTSSLTAVGLLAFSLITEYFYAIF